MKKSLLYIASIFILIFAYSCNDDFLQENRKELDGEYIDGTLVLYSPIKSFEEVTIEIPKLQNLDFKIIQYPDFMEFKSFHGHIDQSGNLTFEVKAEQFYSHVSLEPTYLGEIILDVNKFGLLSIPVVSLDHGRQKASVSKNLIDFDIVHNIAQWFAIENLENGFMFYSLIEKPDWLDIKRHYENGPDMIEQEIYDLSPYGSTSLYLIPDVTNMQPGTYEEELIIGTSDTENPVLKVKVKIQIRSYENPESILSIEGDLIDAVFNKNNNKLYYITQSPSKLISYDISNRSIEEINLGRAPYSVTLSSDAETLLIGQSMQMQFINIETMEALETIPQNHIVTSITDGENGFYYFCGNNESVYSYNKSTKEVQKQSIIDDWGNSRAATFVLKVKDKQQLALQNTGLFPRGLCLVDISEPDNLKFIHYWHQDYGNRLSTSEDFKYLFSESNYVHNFPNKKTDEITTVGVLGSEYNDIRSLHHSKSKSTIWMSHRKYNQNIYKYEGFISAFDDNTFDSKYTIKLNDYSATYNNVKDYYATSAYYIFSATEENKLVLIKNIDDMYIFNARYWHLEVIDIE